MPVSIATAASSRVLIADDEPDICAFIGDVAEGLGLEVAAAQDGIEFERMYPDLRPSIVILDLNLPGHDGIELLRYLAGQNCKASIILASGTDERTLSTAARIGQVHDLNIVGILNKPVSVDDLEAMLKSSMPATDAVTGDDLKAGLADGTLDVYYQPKVAVQAADRWVLRGTEALVRWKHPVHGQISPDAIVSLAQSTDQMRPLTAYVLDKALSQAKHWRDADHDIPVAVNLDPSLLADLTLPDRITRVVAEHGLAPNNLTLEITESGAMADPAATMDILTRLRVKGFGLSLDDFGTGYSSLVQLYRMPFSEIKIDKSFVMDIGRNAEAEVIIGILIDLGSRLGLKLCAEGVETKQALEFLHSLECDLAQGYYFSRPVSGEEFDELIARSSNGAGNIWLEAV